MERYSILRGTRLDGLDTTLGLSGQVPAFLAERNITDASSAVDKVNSFIRGFATLRGYETISQLIKPVAVRYAPMHLYNLPGWANNIEKFCAITVNGSENRVGSRNSTYALTTLFSHDHMLHTTEDGYCYLDQLFGGSLLSWKTVLEYSTLYEQGDGAEQGTIDFEEIPQKVTPKRREADFRIAVRAAIAAVEEKNLVIVLEEGCDFNKRAFELLAEIYSILPPALAAETGYAVYQDPAGIKKLTNETSIRYFLIPAEEADEKLTDTAGCMIVDLNKDKPKLGSSALRTAFETWWDMGWEESRPAMERCFEGVSLTELLGKDTEKSIIVSRTEAYLKARDDLAAWRKNAAMAGTITTLAGLKAEYESHDGWKLLPNADDVFKRRVSTLTGKKKLSTLTEEMIAEVTVDGADDNDPRYALIDFGMSLVKLDAEKTAAKTADKAEAKQRAAVAAIIAEKDAVIAEEQQKSTAALEKEKQRGEAEVQRLNEAHAAAVEDLQAQARKQSEEHAASMEDLRTRAQAKLEDAKQLLISEQEKHKADLDEADRKYKDDMAAEKQRGEAELAAEKQRGETALSAEKQRSETALSAEKQRSEEALAAAEQRRTEEVKTLTEKYTSENGALKETLTRTEASLKEEVTVRKSAEASLNQTKNDLEETRSRLEEEKSSLQKARERLQKTTAERDNALRDRDSAKEECESVKAELDAIPRDLRGAKSRIDELQDELERTPALVRKAWWLPPLLTLLAGALIVGVLWIVLGGISSKKAAAALHEAEARSDKAEQTVSALEDENKELRNEIEELRNEIEELQSAADEQVVPSVNENSDEVVPTEEEPEVTPEAPAVDYAGWDDEEKVNGFLEANADVKSIAFAEEAAEMVPGELRGEWYALAAFSVEENLSNESGSIAILLKASPAVDPSAEGGLNAALHNVNSVSITASGEDGTTADDSVTAGEPAEAEEPAAETAETGTTETREENQDTPVVKFYGAVLKITCGDEMLLVYGDDDMVTAAMEAVPALFENADEVMKVLLNAARSDEEPDLAVDPEMILTKEVLWGESVRWIVDPSRLNAAAENLNTARMPIFGITNGEAASWIYDYRDAPEKITVFMEAYASIGQVTVQNEFVILTVANAPAETEKTEEPAV